MLATNVEYYSAIVLDVAEIPPPLAPAMFACSRVAGWSAHILEQKRTGRLFRPSAKYVGPAAAVALRCLSSPERPPRPMSWPIEATSASSLTLRTKWQDELEGPPAAPTFASARVAYRAIGQFRFRQKLELLRRGLEDESPACRGSALLSLELLSRDHPGDVNAVRPLLHTLATADANEAVRRLAIVCLRNGSPHRDTIVLLEGLADDDEQDRRAARGRETSRAC